MPQPSELVQPVAADVYVRRGDGDDPRIGDVVLDRPEQVWPLRPGDFVLVGFPQDAGVRRNGGRPGAAAAPAAIREQLSKFVAPAGAPAIKDAGDVRADADLAASQARLGAVVAACLAAGARPVVLGGGHETALGHFLGYVAAGQRVGLLNIDAHADVRPLRGGLGHSGSPFREALEHPSGLAAGYRVVGLQRQAVAAAAVEYLRARGASWAWLDDCDCAAGDLIAGYMDTVRRGGAEVLLSVDLDAVRQCDAPGVSAPSPVGLTAERLRELAVHAVRQGARSVDIVELNPSFDRDAQTARLAALLVRDVWLAVAG